MRSMRTNRKDRSKRSVCHWSEFRSAAPPPPIPIKTQSKLIKPGPSYAIMTNFPLLGLRLWLKGPIDQLYAPTFSMQWAIYQLDAKEHAQIDGQSSSRCYFTANCQPDPPLLGHPVLWGNMSKSKKTDWHFTRMHVGTFQSCALNDFCYILFSVYEKNRPRTQRQPQSLVKNPTSNTIHVLASADTTAAVSRTPVRSPIPITTSL